MNRLLLFTLLLCLAGCQKVKESIQEKLIMDFITNGHWKITRYQQGIFDRTAEFNAYKFKFRNNEKIDALKNDVVESTGVWKGDQTNYTIYSNFPTTIQPLSLLNATWTITNGGETFVEANTSINGEPRLLRIEKD